MEKQLKLAFKRDYRNRLTFLSEITDDIDFVKLGIEDKLFENKNGWCDCDSKIINDDLDICKKNEGKFDFGDDIYYWDVAENLSFKEFELFIESNSAYIFEVLDEIGVGDEIIRFLKDKEDDLSFSDFKDLLKKIAYYLYHGTTLSKILEILEIDIITDKKELLKTIKNDKYALQYASEELQNDKEVVLEAVGNYSCALYFASKTLRNDREVVLEAVKYNGFALEYASEELQNDKEVVLIAVENDGYSLRFASEELQNDREVVLTAIKNNGHVLKYASKELQLEIEKILN